ncbi:hypothetical protein ABWK22_02320 [Gottfriedia acidiceleris]|uniref:hypothetical protein n=1 Tax=Gottfriedia acidiceleris TaxID=371036 RepID=UPI0033979CCF
MGVFNLDGIVINDNERHVIVNGKQHNIPKHINTSVITTVNKNIYIGGYELTKSGKWKRTIKAFYNCYIA